MSLLTRIYRLESLAPAIKEVLKDCGLSPYDAAMPTKNQVGIKAPYEPTPPQRRRIEMLFAKDFDLYENAIAL